MRRFRVIEDAYLSNVFGGEDEKVASAGDVVYEFTGPTYGCITPWGVACSVEPGEHPFFEVAWSNLVVVDSVEVDQ